jgi:tryptophan synthase alpha subunit
MSHFVFMLTKDDRTVESAFEIYRRLANTPLRYVGFKDIGLPFEDLMSLAALMRKDGKRVMLEVVSTSREAEIRSIEAAVSMGVDYLLGGRYAEDAVRILKGTDIKYFPFAGATQGHPTRLIGTADDIVEDAKRLAAMPGVHGLDLLAYRFSGDVDQLATRVVQAVEIPVLAAGSIDSNERVQAMRRCGVWGFTVGSAVFDGGFLGDPVAQQIDNILQLDGVMA